MEYQQKLEALAEAMQADLEQGVAWMNDEAWREFEKKYPRLVAAITALLEDLEPDRIEPLLDRLDPEPRT